jgi:hypothetical protein
MTIVCLHDDGDKIVVVLAFVALSGGTEGALRGDNESPSAAAAVTIALM